MQNTFRRLSIATFLAVALATMVGIIRPGLVTVVIPVAITTYVLVSVWIAPPFIRSAAIVFLVAAGVGLKGTSHPVSLWSTAIARNAGLFVLFTAVPLLSFTFSELTRRVESERTKPTAPWYGWLLRVPVVARAVPLAIVAFVQFLLAIIMSIGAVWIAVPIFRADNLPDRTIHRGVALGYSLNVTVSPFDIIVHTVLLFSGIAYYRYLPGALIVAFWYLFTFFIVDLYSKRRRRRESTVQALTSEPVFTVPAYLRPRAGGRWFFAHIGVLFLSAVVGTALFPEVSGATVTGIVALVYSILWILLSYGRSAFLSAGRRITQSIPQFAGFLPLLVSATFFGSVLPETGFNRYVSPLLGLLISLPPYVAVFSVIVGTIVLAWLGIHMLVPIAIVGSIVTPEMLGLTSVGYAVTLIVAYVAAMNSSPFVPFINVLASATNQKSPFGVIGDTIVIWALIVVGSPLVITLAFSI